MAEIESNLPNLVAIASNVNRVRSGIITLLTDFGTEDYFVGAMKGVILQRFSQAVLVDITHDIPPHNIPAAAFTLDAASRYFPPGTVHLAVIDPGVGSERRALIVASGDHFFVGPDNGVFSLVLSRDRGALITSITNRAYFLPDVSFTFHGRDIFSPVAAALARGEPPDVFGPGVRDPVALEWSRNHLAIDGSLQGSIIHIDHFGNCITTFTLKDLRDGGDGEFCFRAKGTAIRKLLKYYDEAGPDVGNPFLIVGSAGFLEIAIARSSAARKLNLAVGTPVRLEFC
jgi:S-adenosylmethionine hydrolase